MTDFKFIQKWTNSLLRIRIGDIHYLEENCHSIYFRPMHNSFEFFPVNSYKIMNPPPVIQASVLACPLPVFFSPSLSLSFSLYPSLTLSLPLFSLYRFLTLSLPLPLFHSLPLSHSFSPSLSLSTPLSHFLSLSLFLSLSTPLLLLLFHHFCP